MQEQAILPEEPFALLSQNTQGANKGDGFEKSWFHWRSTKSCVIGVNPNVGSEPCSTPSGTWTGIFLRKKGIQSKPSLATDTPQPSPGERSLGPGHVVDDEEGKKAATRSLVQPQGSQQTFGSELKVQLLSVSKRIPKISPK